MSLTGCPGCTTGGILPHAGDCQFRPPGTTYSGLPATSLDDAILAAVLRDLLDPYNGSASLWTVADGKIEIQIDASTPVSPQAAALITKIQSQ